MYMICKQYNGQENEKCKKELLGSFSKSVRIQGIALISQMSKLPSFQISS